MTCTQFTAGGVNVVTALVTGVSATLYSQQANYEYWQINISTGAGSGAQPVINITDNGSPASVAVVDRPINGIVSPIIVVPRDGAVHNICAI